MLIKLIRLFLGFVEFEASDGFAERFLNLCTINGITLWQVQNTGVKVKACTPLKAYKNIRKVARKSGMRVRITRKRGLPFFLKYNKVRAGVIVGLFISCAFLSLSSCMLWNIEVSGNESIKTEKLMESLESNGVRVGVLKSKIDTEDLAKQLLDEYNDLSWASLNIFGTKAVLEVKENSKKPQIIDGSRAMNLVAKKAGQIVAVEGHKGSNAVKEGNAVVKGDLLISGVVANSDGSEQTVRAMGRVIAKTETTLKSESQLEVESAVLQNAENKHYLYALGAQIPLFLKCKGEELYNGEMLLKSKSGQLPFGVKWAVVGEFEESNVTLTENQALLLALADAVNKKRYNCSGDCEIQAVKYTKEAGVENVKITCKIDALENIAEEKEFFLE